MNILFSAKPARFTSLAATVAAILIPVVLAGCTTTHYRKSADKETYGILKQKSGTIANAPTQYTIEPNGQPELDGLPTIKEADKSLGPAAQEEVGAHIISLEHALELAVKHNRNYQNQKELLYLSALQLTEERYHYAPIFSAGGDAKFNDFTQDHSIEGSAAGKTAKSSADIMNDVNTLAGTPAALIENYQTLAKDAMSAKNASGDKVNIVDEQTIEGSVSLGVEKLMKGGGRIAVNLTSDFFRYITGDPRVATSSALVAEFSQPLLRGRGAKVAAERLTQAERDVLYALRDFTRFRKEFAVEIARSYYNVLRDRDAVRNNYSSYVAFRDSRARDQAMFTEGRKSMSDLGRTQQASLRSENTWTNSVRRYQKSLDNFKILLGLPVDTKIALDKTELDRIKQSGIHEWNISEDDAIMVALHSRLDLYNARDALEDAARKVEVQVNQFLPDLNFVLMGRINSKPGDRFQDPDLRRASWNAGLNLDLPLDRKSERNAYRSRLISLEKADRQLELEVDTVKLDVRNALRSLEEAKQTYEINKLGVKINENRVAEAKLLAELGRGRSQDLVDAQNDLTSARNTLTAALIDYKIASLEFWRDMGILFIKDDGQWEQLNDKIETTSTNPIKTAQAKP
ncbi:MAG: TolC family protein [Candidatus Hydrogenedentes bacterium]|nr:TolC family protein [Candidatus Hydrogenedentota bacterium]